MRQLLASCLMVGFLAMGTIAHAGPPLSYDQIRTAREKGEIRSLRWVMHQIQPYYPGRLLDAELSRKNGRYVYRIKLLQPGGYVSRLMVDAYTAEILKARSRPLEKRKH
ncbi:MAG TPA: PepSY domain-containing protein [Paenalcaligenes hominis]|uniref:Membrane protein YkoI n=1 Tax=Paenalcaligenes hominis TaxID=643674 RepID=A0A9D2VFC3_9BURK|nr:PepSY domain-containing protein [Paenalcaligenes hominis]NJB64892.1 putative membrane protein YkoI [Paenalcaligenes hominis]HJH23519.1 PepSY domain-containing protein [Paenalcaligenes hominis]